MAIVSEIATGHVYMAIFKEKRRKLAFDSAAADDRFLTCMMYFNLILSCYGQV